MEKQTGPAFKIRALAPADKDRASRLIAQCWGSSIVIAHGTRYTPSDLPGFVAFQQDEWLGLVTYHIQGNQCEIVTLDSLRPSVGIGTALLQSVRQAAIEAKCTRLWLITTNDNLNALRFYQKRGLVLVAVHRDAMAQARKLKPEIPLIGAEDIPLRDEIELEMAL